MIDPRLFKGTVEGTHDGDVTRRRTTSSVAARLNSLVAVNGGFFVTSDADGVQGTMSGLGAYDGRLGSMAAGARAALILGDGGSHIRVADLTTTVTARAGNSSYRIQGINRVPGLVRDCGRPGAVPSALPWQDVTCRLTDDLVRFTPSSVPTCPPGPARRRCSTRPAGWCRSVRAGAGYRRAEAFSRASAARATG
ncbi:hypothetical protein AB0I77_10470 [Streptomyces sp. NPDC050619]|uniref:hypothetical protein n=1 Tax=Streptomyces sp. NPDC050619 TaxID=3157214 RepID=UPI003430E476